jgi:hypothetical protein
VRSAAVLLCFAALAAAAPAAAQQNSDPIGALLERQGKVLPEDEATAEESRSRPAAPAPEDSLPATPTAPAPRLTAPVHVEETAKSPDGPPTPRDLAYESRLRASFASAQRFQGSLDGSWTIAGPTGDLYALELVDRGRNVVEGAWRDLRRKGAVGASGFVDEIERVGSEMTLRFAGGASATLESQPDGRWTGQLTEAGQTSSVTLRKSGP